MYMNKAFLFLFFIAAVVACNQRQSAENTDTEIVVGEQNEISTEEVEDLVVKIMINNRLKTALAHLANEKAVNPRIASFSQMIIDNNDVFEDNMIRIAEAYEIEPPSGLTLEAQKQFEELSNLPTDEFQREFLNTTISTHEETLERFERLMARTGNPIERSLLQNVRDALHQHVEIARNLQDEIIAGQSN
jgi:putative membrane protein